MKKYLVVLFGILFISFVSAVPSPHAFYGEVNYSNGDAVGVGTIIAMIDESIVGNSDIIDGVYDLTAESEYGGLIYFYFNGEPLANYIFNSFEITELNFVLSMPSSEDEEEPEDEEEDSSSHTTITLKQFCEPSWTCGGWSSCDDGRMTRTCYDANYCDYSYNMPNEVAGCGISEKVFVEERNYFPIIAPFVVLTLVALIVLVSVFGKK